MAPDPKALAGAVGDTDGARPGAEAGDTPRGPQYAFDADARAKNREAAPVTIGEKVYHRRRKNWEATRALRKQLRAQEKATSQRDRVNARIERLMETIRGVRDRYTGDWIIPPVEDEDRIDRVETQVEELEAKVEELMDASDDAAYAIIATLLKDADGAPPAIAHLKESLDVEEAGALAAHLSTGGEVDPTPAIPSS